MPRSRLVLIGLFAVACVAALTVPSAFAAERPYESQLTEANGSNFSTPFGLSVDGSDNLWVSDTGTSRVNKFDSSGLYQAQNTGAGSWGGSPYIESLAFSEATGKVFVSDSNQDDLWGLNLTTAYSGTHFTSGLGGGCCYLRLAADNSGGAATGDLYVSGVSGSVLRIDSSGTPHNFSASASYISGNKLTGTPTGSFGGFSNSGGSIAVDSSGDLYVATSGRVDRFDSTGAFIQSYNGADAPGSLGSLPGVAVDPTNGNLLVIGSGNVVYEFDSSGSYLGQITGTSPGTPFGTLRGLAVDSNGRLYVADAGEHVVDVFGPGIVLPKITYGAVTGQTHTSGTLNASIDLNGGPSVTSCEFQYGPDTGYGSIAPCSPAAPYSGPTSISTDVAALTPETTYHYRVVLTTANGTANGADRTFTPRAVFGLATDPASQLTASTATLNGSFTGEGEDVHYYFEWSSDESFGNKSAVPPGVLVPSASGLQSVSFDLNQLEPETLFHYRIVASNAFGTTVGQTQTFSTQGRYQFSTYYGSAGSGDGQLNGPKDVAVDPSTGAIYVADYGNHRVVKFSSSGNFIAAWGWGVDGGVGFQVCSSGCQAGISGSGPGQFDGPEFIEVDNSKGPSKGNVYVADTARGDVQKFDSTGGLVSTWGEGGAIDFSGVSPIQGITVDNDGSLFVGLQQSPPTSSENHWMEVGQDGVYRNTIPTGSIGVEHFMSRPDGHGIDIGPTGNFYQASVGGVDVSPPGAARDAIERYWESEHGPDGDPTGLAVDRSTGDLYTGHGTFLYQFLASQKECYHDQAVGTSLPCEPSAKFGSGLLNGAFGLALEPSTGILYAANSGADNIAVFAPLPVPDVTTKSATDVGATSATLSGHVAPAGPASIVDCYFEYGTDSSLDLGVVPCDQSTPIVAASDVSADVTGLSPFTSYRYRLVAVQSDGQGYPSHGRELTFTPVSADPPGIGATSFSDVTQTSVRVDGTINPNLAPTTYVFQYGTTPGYGSHTLASGSIGDDSSFHPVSAVLTGLSPATTYHFRLVAVNFTGTGHGPDITFTTPGDVTPTLPSGPPAAPVVTADRRVSSSNCAKLDGRAEKNRQKAMALRRRAKRASDPVRSRVLRRQADRAAKKAQQLGRKAKSCAAASGKASR